MKKVIGFIIVIIILATVGFIAFFMYQKEQTYKSLEKDITEYAEDYFDKYMSTNASSNMYKVTLADLKKANKEDADYNLKSFDKCEDDTAVTLTINFQNGKVKKSEVELNCK